MGGIFTPNFLEKDPTNFTYITQTRGKHRFFRGNHKFLESSFCLLCQRLKIFRFLTFNSYSWLNSKVMKYFSKMDFFYATFIIFGVQLMGFSLFFEDKKRLFQIATHTSLFLYIAWFLLKNYCIQHFLISISNIIYNNSLFYYIPFMLTHHSYSFHP